MVRTRFAPSPTGYMHIGNLRSGLYAFLFARHEGGKFVLRIEDTDRKRNVPAAIQVIYDSLKLAGLDYDEGPDKGGPYGPYTQSERRHFYRQYAEELVAKGAAYRCFCSKGQLEQRRTRQQQGVQISPNLRDTCRSLSSAEVEVKLAAGEPFVIRQRIPEEGSTSFDDLIFGTITVENKTLDDQVLLKSDGFATYNFANVVDDHLMAISHVLRGVEYLSSTPKYNLLYQSFGWPIPVYVHLPHIVKEGGKKLSKRAGDASFQDLLAQGYLPQAVVNYIALLGWNPGTDQEFFTLEELIKVFDIRRINKASAGFAIAKLDWLNGQHIRSLPPETFAALAEPFYPPKVRDYLDTHKISMLIQPRLVRLTDIPTLVAFFLAVQSHEVLLYDQPKSKSTVEQSRQVLVDLQPLLENLPDWTNEAIQQRLVGYAGEHGLKTGAVMWPLRVALSGLQSTPGGATEIAEILGKQETLKRIGAALEELEPA